MIDLLNRNGAEREFVNAEGGASLSAVAEVEEFDLAGSCNCEEKTGVVGNSSDGRCSDVLVVLGTGI